MPPLDDASPDTDVGHDPEDEGAQAAAADHARGALEVALVLGFPLAEEPLLRGEQVLEDAARALHRPLPSPGANLLHRARGRLFLVAL